MVQDAHLGFEETPDLSEFLAVMHAAFDRYRSDPQPSSAMAETVESLQRDIRRGWRLYGMRLSMGLSRNVLVGTVKTYPHGENLYFGRLAVAPDFQGRGIAKALVGAIELDAYARGFSGVECKARISETGNIAMYLKWGYSEISRETTTSTTGQPIPTVTLRRQLAPPTH